MPAWYCNQNELLPCNWMDQWLGCACPNYGTNPNVAVVGAPSGSVLTVPPANGQQAQDTVNALTNQLIVDQQNLNASNVSSGIWDQLLGGAGAAGGGVSSLFNSPLFIGVAAIVVVGVVTSIGSGGPRRYGR